MENKPCSSARKKVAEDSRYARIMKVMHDTEQQRPKLRRLGDQLGRGTRRWPSLLPS